MSYHRTMQSVPGSFSWSEDLDETLNYWFWLRRVEPVSDATIAAKVRDAAQPPLMRHRDVEALARRNEYLKVWQVWKRARVEAQIEESRGTPQSTARAHYNAVAEIGLESLHIQWVMAPLGERWLVKPDTAVLGIEGATAEQRREAIITAAQLLRRV